MKTHYLNDFKASDWNESNKTHLGFPIVAGFFPLTGGQGITGAAAEVPTPAVFAQGGAASRPGAGWVIASSLLLQNAEVSAEWPGLVVIIAIVADVIIVIVCFPFPARLLGAMLRGARAALLSAVVK